MIRVGQTDNRPPKYSSLKRMRFLSFLCDGPVGIQLSGTALSRVLGSTIP